MDLLRLLILSLFVFCGMAGAEESCLELYKKQAEENDEEYRKRQDRHVHGEVTFSGNGKTYSFDTHTKLSNGNMTFSGEQGNSGSSDYRNDEKIALELLYSEDILRIVEGEAYAMLTHLQHNLQRKNINKSISEIQQVIKEGFKTSEFCKDGKITKRAGQIIRFAKKELKYESINNTPRQPTPQKLADDFNTERDVAGKKKSTETNKD